MKPASIPFAIRRYDADCRGKEPFDAPSLARQVANRMRRKHRAAQVYRCSHCGRWHIGSSVRAW